MDYQNGGYASPSPYPYSQPHMMAKGGLAAAQDLASKGRNGDSMLVHMTPNEVSGLQALAVAHGGSLTVNPQTGLVEANFLESLLPTLIGVGLNFMFPGSGALIGMGVGALETARTGDIGKGILAGLGAYGGASLGTALTSTGTQALTTNLEGEALNQLTAEQAAAQATSQAGINPSTFGGQLDLAQRGLSTAVQDPSAFMTNLTGPTGPLNTTFKQVAAAAPTALSLMPQPKPLTPIEPEESNYAGPYVPQPRTVRYPTDRDPRDSSEFTYFSPMNPYPGFQPAATAADGGLMQLARKDGGFDMRDGSFVMSAREVAEVGNGSSNAGLERLSKMGAQPIRGKGDGVSDSIRANIGGEQEARVARDEAYFPPEAVKKIGKGNPKKGAQKLYALMSAAEKARKKAPRGEDSGLHRLMPA